MYKNLQEYEHSAPLLECSGVSGDLLSGPDESKETEDKPRTMKKLRDKPPFSKPDRCRCIKVCGHLEAVKWLLSPREYRPSAGVLAKADFTERPHIWLHYVESSDGMLPKDDVLRNTNSKYWSIHDVQRYFVGNMHCEQVLFTYQYPNLRMPTRLGSHMWLTNASTKVFSKQYQKEFGISLEVTLKKIEFDKAQIDRLIVSDQLIKLDRLDYFKRKTFFRILGNIMSYQDRLQLVSFENMCCKRLEGVKLITQLATFNAHSLKYLFLWRWVQTNENPILVNYSYITGSGAFIPRPPTKQCFLRSLAELRNLRLLALEFSHIADSTGEALLTLLPILRRPHFRLQLICREDQVPGRADAALGVGGHHIPDTAWRQVTIACPDLYLHMAFYRIREYDNVRRYLTPSMPLHEAHLELGIDLEPQQRQDSDVSCFVRHVAFRYASTLATVSIHQWRFALFPLRRVFELMPRLRSFYYVGCVEDEVDLHRMLSIVASGVCDKLKHVRIQIQDEESKRQYWQDVVESLSEEYTKIMDMLGINLSLDIYRI